MDLDKVARVRYFQEHFDLDKVARVRYFQEHFDLDKVARVRYFQQHFDLRLSVGIPAIFNSQSSFIRATDSGAPALPSRQNIKINTLRTGDADLRF